MKTLERIVGWFMVPLLVIFLYLLIWYDKLIRTKLEEWGD